MNLAEDTLKNMWHASTMAEEFWEELEIQKRFDCTKEELEETINKASQKQFGYMYFLYGEEGKNFKIYDILKNLGLKPRNNI